VRRIIKADALKREGKGWRGGEFKIHACIKAYKWDTREDLHLGGPGRGVILEEKKKKRRRARQTNGEGEEWGERGPAQLPGASQES